MVQYLSRAYTIDSDSFARFVFKNIRTNDSSSPQCTPNGSSWDNMWIFTAPVATFLSIHNSTFSMSSVYSIFGVP